MIREIKYDRLEEKAASLQMDLKDEKNVFN